MINRNWFLATLVTGLAMSVTHVATVTRQSVPVRLSPGVVGASCVLESSGSTLSPILGLSQLKCEATDATLRCSFDNAEPFDVKVADLCARPRTIQTAHTVVLQLHESSEVGVEWLQLQPVGVRVVASRRMSGEALRIPVVLSPDRFVRITDSRRAPITFRTTQFVSESTQLPPFLDGGEVVLVSQPNGQLAPEAYQIQGPGGLSTEIGADLAVGMASIRGLSEGVYTITPIYQSRIAAEPRAVTVQTGRTTFARYDDEDVGAINVAIDPALCSLVTAAVVERLLPAQQPSGRRTIKRHEACDVRVGGLSPGFYEVRLVGPQDALESAHTNVSRGVIAQVFVSANASVAGSLRINHQPGVEKAVELMRISAGEDGPIRRAYTDAAGSFQAEGLSPGDYRLRLSQGGVQSLGQEKRVKLRPGLNKVDWDVSAGSVTLKLLGGAMAEPVSVAITQTEPIQPGMFRATHSFNRRLTTEPVVDGLAPGKYTVQARQRHLVSELVPLTVGAAEETHNVQLSLAEYEAQLELVDESGAKVTGAWIANSSGTEASPVGEGVYLLGGMAPGGPVYIRARGHAPYCKHAPSSGRMQVVLKAGRDVQFIFSGSTSNSPAGRILWPDVDCPVPLNWHSFRPQGRTTDGETVFALSNVAPEFRFLYLANAFDTEKDAQVIAVGSDSTVRLSLRPPK